MSDSFAISMPSPDETVEALNGLTASEGCEEAHKDAERMLLRCLIGLGQLQVVQAWMAAGARVGFGYHAECVHGPNEPA